MLARDLLGAAGDQERFWDRGTANPSQTVGLLGLTTATNLTNSFGGGSRPNNNGTSGKLSGSAVSRLNQWFNTSVFSQPPAFTFGSTGRALPDVRANLQFRAEFFNILNHVRFHNPGLTYGTPQFGIVSAQVNEPRLIQVALKLLF